MPGNERALLAHYPHHLVRKTKHGRNAFSSTEDCERCEEDIRYLADYYGIRLHSWCILRDRIHILATPGEDARILSTYMKAIICRAVLRSRRNRRNRTGTDTGTGSGRKKPDSPWSHHYQSSPVEPGKWVLACMCYIEYLPITIGRTDSTLHDYPSSSYRMRLSQEQYSLDDPEEYTRLGSNAVERAEAFRRRLQKGLENREVKMIETAVQRGKLTGSMRFVTEVYKQFGIFAPNRGIGRPSKPDDEPGDDGSDP